MTYNLTNYTSADNLLEIAVATNGLSGGLFFVIVLGLVFLISFVSMKNYPAKDAFLSSSFLSLVAGAVLWAVELLPEQYLLGFFVLFIISLVVHRLSA